MIVTCHGHSALPLALLPGVVPALPLSLRCVGGPLVPALPHDDPKIAWTPLCSPSEPCPAALPEGLDLEESSTCWHWGLGASWALQAVLRHIPDSAHLKLSPHPPS